MVERVLNVLPQLHTFFYRNAIQNQLDVAQLSVGGNFDELFNTGGLHRFSVRVMYFLDYNYLTKNKNRGNGTGNL